ncbi:hypothetical protein K461DRAFT_276427 [Myriangium duriaei CBS 260.36]|uniref:Methyltransferase domain-containing protein n=1 Tax=Myriangium duriaei CBS 260.36 TaxID=1168546 RepID=A0A9P4MJE8_9PEZI|nr:hypothetical protein K461DRAFT_276427 [Myriangium duriaei CBS 260.36]
MESGFVYLYMSDEIGRARRQRDAELGIVRTRSGSTTTTPSTSSPPSPLSTGSPRSDPTSALQRSPTSPGRKDSVLSRSAKMDLFVGPGPFAVNTFAMPEKRRADAAAENEAEDLLLQSTPFETRDGRPYLRNTPYFLPCDLIELHRQSLRTMLNEEVFLAPTCAPFSSGLPKKVLEVGCGSGFWSSTCHDHFRSLGHDDVSFTGVDIVPLAPNLREQGVNWNFVQHDLRKFPWPFEEGEFDYIMVKDVSLGIPLEISQRFVDECVRVLGEDGTLEVWESDHILRCLVQHNQPPLWDSATRTYPITPALTFNTAQNRFIQDANSWIEQACEQRRLPPTPCGRVADMLSQEPDLLHKVASKRTAIPLTELSWEYSGGRRPSAGMKKHKCKGKTVECCPTADQSAIRHTALMTVIQKIESLEPVLKEYSGKNTEEWASWWANMMSSLLDQNGVASGECLEIGAWWTTKRRRSQ